jgi:hypothetical protein
MDHRRRSSLNVRSFRLAALAVTLLTLAACVGGPPTPSPEPTGTPGPAMTAGELRYAIVDRFGPRWYCDPDEYPIRRGTDLESALARWEEVAASGDLFGAILTRHGIAPAATYTDDQKLAVYEDYKVLASIPLEPIGNGRYRFDYLAMPAAGAESGTRTAGIVDEHGVFTIEQQAPAGEPICPICLARGTAVETPAGPVAVERLRIGDAVWTMDEAGRRVEATVVALGRAEAPAGHRVVRLVLADGRTVTASPGHPLGDGRTLGDLHVGDLVDGSAVTAADLVAYDGPWTFDIAVSGPTGLYLVDGIPLGSTLVR